MKLKTFSHTYAYPTAQPPEWSAYVERWYQLDAAAYGMTALYWRNRDQLHAAPRMIFLASPGASNFTDAQFALSEGLSPAKFVHTLPNVRSAALLQVMNWSGSVFCLQNDPATILAGLREAVGIGGEGEDCIWVVAAHVCANGEFQADLFVLGSSGPLIIRKSAAKAMEIPVAHDKHWLSWLKRPEQDRSEFVGPGFVVSVG